MASRKTVKGRCAKCGTETEHNIVAMHSDGVGFCFGMECPECGTLVPERAWIKYLKTGDIIVPNLRRATNAGMKANTNVYL